MRQNLRRQALVSHRSPHPLFDGNPVEVETLQILYCLIADTPAGI